MPVQSHFCSSDYPLNSSDPLVVPYDRVACSRQHYEKKKIESDFQKGSHSGKSIIINGKPPRICSSFLFHFKMSMHVVRMQLFSLIIRSSEVESTHLCGVEKSLALFIPHSILRGCFPGWFCVQESRLVHTSAVRAWVSDKDPSTGKFKFLC